MGSLNIPRDLNQMMARDSETRVICESSQIPALSTDVGPGVAVAGHVVVVVVVVAAAAVVTMIDLVKLSQLQCQGLAYVNGSMMSFDFPVLLSVPVVIPNIHLTVEFLPLGCWDSLMLPKWTTYAWAMAAVQGSAVWNPC